MKITLFVLVAVLIALTGCADPEVATPRFTIERQSRGLGEPLYIITDEDTGNEYLHFRKSTVQLAK